MIRYKRPTDGFTIIELLLAMTGIAFLLLFVVFAIVHVTGLYTKGIAIRQINQVGRQLTDDISRAVRYGAEPTVVPDKNRFCAGGKSYIWNDSDYSDNKFTDRTDVGFVSVDDITYCELPDSLVPASAQKLTGNVVEVRDINISQYNSLPIYDLLISLSTKGDASMFITDPLDPSRLICNPSDGQFCAIGEFNATVYARNQ